MNLFTRIEEILSATWGDDHLKYVTEMIVKISEFIESDFFDNPTMRDAAVDELIEFLQSKKSKPKDNGHA